MDPLLIDVPTRIVTDRFILRRPLPGDGPVHNEAVCASIDELRPWLQWAQQPPSVEESEATCRRLHAAFGLRNDLAIFVFERNADSTEAALIGGSGLHRIDWQTRRFEIGYWRRSGHDGRGVITETVKALARTAFDRLGARRVEIRTDATHERSWRVAERAGFTLEGVLRKDSVTPQGKLRDTRVYARVRGDEEPFSVEHDAGR